MGYTELVLSLVQKPQAKSYYCGPATAFEILDYLDDRGYNVIGPDGESLTQGHVAGPCETGYLCTNYLGETPWYYYSGYPHPMKRTLNQWAGTLYYVVTNATTTAEWQSDMSFDIVHEYPIASDVREWEDHGYRLVGHPNADIGHWVAVHGFKDDLDTTRYADSVHGTTFWSWSDHVQAHSDIPSYKFRWLMWNDSRGYIW